MEEVIEQIPDAQPEVQATLTAEEIADLQAKANVSSQNFERLKKAEAEKKELQEKIALLESTTYTNEDPLVVSKLAELDAKLNRIEEEKQIDSTLAKYPILADKKAEFDEFRKEYPGAKMENVAKIFLAENDLLELPKKRKGLETGGTQKVAPESGKMSAEDVKRLRTTNGREYLKLVREGRINLA